MRSKGGIESAGGTTRVAARGRKAHCELTSDRLQTQDNLDIRQPSREGPYTRGQQILQNKHPSACRSSRNHRTRKPPVSPPNIGYHLGKRSRAKGGLAERMSNYVREAKRYWRKTLKCQMD